MCSEDGQSSFEVKKTKVLTANQFVVRTFAISNRLKIDRDRCQIPAGAELKTAIEIPLVEP